MIVVIVIVIVIVIIVIINMSQGLPPGRGRGSVADQGGDGGAWLHGEHLSDAVRAVSA